MASRNVKRALLGFAQGALQGVMTHYQTKAMQEAELLKEQRLAAIRAEDREANQSFQRQMTREQIAAQAARDEAATARETERLASQAAQDDKRLAQQERLTNAQLQAQREIAGQPARSQPVPIVVDDGKGGRVTRFVDPTSEEARTGISGLVANTAAPMANADVRAAEAEGAVGGTEQKRDPYEGASCMLSDGRTGKWKGRVCVPD